MTEVIISLLAPVLVIFVVVLVGERITSALEAVVAFVWSVLD